MFLDDMATYLTQTYALPPATYITGKPPNTETRGRREKPRWNLVSSQRNLGDEDFLLILGRGLTDRPHRQVALMETRGVPYYISGREAIGGPIFTMGGRRDDGHTPDPVAERYGMWMSVRAGVNEYESARTMCQIVYDIFSGMRGYVSKADGQIALPKYHYQWVIAQQPPYYIDVDENDRPILGCNFAVSVSRDATPLGTVTV